MAYGLNIYVLNRASGERGDEAHRPTHYRSPDAKSKLHHGDASSTSPSASLRPKATSHGGSLSYESGDIGTTKYETQYGSK